MEEHLTVGRVAELAGVSVRTLHHYDEIGLVRPSARTAAGYRAYSADDVGRLREVGHLTGAGSEEAGVGHGRL
ncbi:MerR family transcriptional regulator, partial [Streptomyces tendae]